VTSESSIQLQMSGVCAVRFAGVFRHYGKREVVQDVSLEIRRGEVFGLLGPNGSGKSTLIRMLVGLVTPTRGSVSVAGFDVVQAAPSARRLIGYVPEDIQLYPGMRTLEFLRCMGGLRGLRGKDLVRACDRAIERLALGPVCATLMGRLSHGYRQRVLLAQALLGDPAVIVLDEPGNGLDPQQIIELRHLITGLSGDHTVIVTSHVLGEVEQVAARVAVLREGRLLAVLPVGEAADTAELRVPTSELMSARQALERAGCTVLACDSGARGLEARYLALIQGTPGPGGDA
jgi:ABC-2 type transport system ATP-binding protein